MSKMPTIILTDSIRSLPYFSSFTEDQVEVPDKPYLQELLTNKLELAHLSIPELLSCIETCIYFSLDTFQLCSRLIRKISVDETTFHQWFIQGNDREWSLSDNFPAIVRAELENRIQADVRKMIGAAKDFPLPRTALIKLGFKYIFLTSVKGMKNHSFISRPF